MKVDLKTWDDSLDTEQNRPLLCNVRTSVHMMKANTNMTFLTDNSQADYNKKNNCNSQDNFAIIINIMTGLIIKNMEVSSTCKVYVV